MTTTPPVGATTPTTPSSSTSGSAVQQLAGNFDTFLTLLTTQLKNQDPLSPLDTNQFTQQLVSFSGVEQSIQTNQNLQSILGVQKSSQAADAVSYIGRGVTANTDQASLSGGQATWNYDLSNATDKTGLVVTDANNQVVAVAAGETAAGAHSFTWDGKDSSGTQLPDGVYTLSIAATDAAGQDVPVNQSASGVVDGIDTSGDSPMLSMNGLSIGLASITGVNQPPNS